MTVEAAHVRISCSANGMKMTHSDVSLQGYPDDVLVNGGDLYELVLERNRLVSRVEELSGLRGADLLHLAATASFALSYLDGRHD